MVGPNGFEPSTSSVSRKRSGPAELRAYIKLRGASILSGQSRIRQCRRAKFADSFWPSPFGEAAFESSWLKMSAGPGDNLFREESSQQERSTSAKGACPRARFIQPRGAGESDPGQSAGEILGHDSCPRTGGSKSEWSRTCLVRRSCHDDAAGRAVHASDSILPHASRGTRGTRFAQRQPAVAFGRDFFRPLEWKSAIALAPSNGNDARRATKSRAARERA